MKVNWNEQGCCHSGNCVRTLPEVFAVENGKFVIRPDKASEEAVLAAIAACPSQALSRERDDAA